MKSAAKLAVFVKKL